MSKTKTVHRCLECGAAAPKWAGQCSTCQAWNTLVEELEVPANRARPDTPAVPVPIGQVDLGAWQPRATGLDEFDRALSGGLVPGSVTMLGGEPGIGKSTLLLQVAAGLAREGANVLYVSAEESAQQVRLRAERVGAIDDRLWLVSQTAVPTICAHLDELRPDVVVVDSIQTVYDPALGSSPGTLGQVREAAHRFVVEAKVRSIAVVLVGHVTKDGGLAGPRVIEHVVDTVAHFEGDRHHALRILRPSKHRFGSTDELGLFEMTPTGLRGVPDPSALFLAHRRPGTAGSVVVPTLDGGRPLLVEVQALVAETNIPTPRRSAKGVDAGRLSVILAVLHSRAGVALSKHDVYAVAAGGARTVEPGADLGIALAVMSALSGEPVATDCVAMGEIGLGGEIRPVPQLARRLAEAERMGFTTALVPDAARDIESRLDLMAVHTVRMLAEGLDLGLYRGVPSLHLTSSRPG